MMKKIISILLFGLLILSFFVIADNPPNLLNHQFYGDVIWTKSTVVPKEVIAKVGNQSFKSLIEDSPCLESTCVRKYGYDSNNILRVQAKAGETIHFFVDNTKVKDYVYSEGEVTELNLDLTIELKGDSTSSKRSRRTRINVTQTNATETLSITEPETEVPEQEPIPQEHIRQEPIQQESIQQEPIQQEPRLSLPSSGVPKIESFEPGAEPDVQEEKSNKLFLIILGILFIIIAIVILIFVLRMKDTFV